MSELKKEAYRTSNIKSMFVAWCCCKERKKNSLYKQSWILLIMIICNKKKTNSQQLQVQIYIVKIANFLINNIIVVCESHELIMVSKAARTKWTHYAIYFVFYTVCLFNINIKIITLHFPNTFRCLFDDKFIPRMKNEEEED